MNPSNPLVPDDILVEGHQALEGQKYPCTLLDWKLSLLLPKQFFLQCQKT